MNDIAVYIALAIIVALFVYMRVSKLFGAMLVFSSGLGIMGTTTGNDTWVGLIILLTGFLLLIYALIEKPSNKKRKF